MPARNLQMISYQTRVRDSSYDYYSSDLLMVVRTQKGKATGILSNELKATQAYDHSFCSSLKHITWMQHCLCPCAQLCALLYLPDPGLRNLRAFCLPATPYAVI